MKAFCSVLAASALFSGVFAAPVAQLSQVESIVTEVTSEVPAVGDLVKVNGLDLPVKRSVVVISGVQSTVEGLKQQIFAHTAIINQTLAGVSPGADPSAAIGTVTAELTAITAVISGVVGNLPVVGGPLSASTAEVTAIAGVLAGVIAEITATVSGVTGSLGGGALPLGSLSTLTTTLATLLSTVEGIVGGVIPVVTSLLSSAGVLSEVQSVLGGVLGGLLGKLPVVGNILGGI